MSELSYLLAQIVDGIAYGSIYGMFALSIVFLYRSNKIFNLGLTEIATLFVIFAYLLLQKLPFAPAIGLAILLSFVSGVLLHVGVMRFVTERKHVLHGSQTVITLGFFTLFNSLSSFILGDEPMPFPSPFGLEVYTIGGVGISKHSIGIFAVAILMVWFLFLCFRFTKVGLIFEAIAENIVAARLRGIQASNFLALAWGLTVAAGAIGGMLFAPILYVTPNMLTSIAVYSFIAVVIGGLESPLGALVGGIIVGIIENVASNISFIGSELKFLVLMAVLIVFLIIRPRGIWGRAEGRRV
jgi:branched-chain amino acid transport system permease protein